MLCFQLFSVFQNATLPGKLISKFATCTSVKNHVLGTIVIIRRCPILREWNKKSVLNSVGSVGAVVSQQERERKWTISLNEV